MKKILLAGFVALGSLSACNSLAVDAMIRQNIDPAEYENMSDEAFNARTKRMYSATLSSKGISHYKGPGMYYTNGRNGQLNAFIDPDGTTSYTFTITRLNYNEPEKLVYDRAVDPLGTEYPAEVKYSTIIVKLPREYLEENRFSDILMTVYEARESAERRGNQSQSGMSMAMDMLGWTNSNPDNVNLEFRIPAHYTDLFLTTVDTRVAEDRQAAGH
ncbi:MAG: hypothetical protein EP335_05755 [Alphaproteobacteria bacterium]|nr:MAG: hypothetical protein EP335_05755 [Alphaproteobacteria bacterium]